MPHTNDPSFIDVDTLNARYQNRCCSFFEDDRRRIGIIERFHYGSNMVTISVGSEVFEVPRGNVTI